MKSAKMETKRKSLESMQQKKEPSYHGCKNIINHEHCKLYAASVSAVSSKEIKQLESKLFKFIWEE